MAITAQPLPMDHSVVFHKTRCRLPFVNKSRKRRRFRLRFYVQTQFFFNKMSVFSVFANRWLARCFLTSREAQLSELISWTQQVAWLCARAIFALMAGLNWKRPGLPVSLQITCQKDYYLNHRLTLKNAGKSGQESSWLWIKFYKTHKPG